MIKYVQPKLTVHKTLQNITAGRSYTGNNSQRKPHRPKWFERLFGFRFRF